MILPKLNLESITMEGFGAYATRQTVVLQGSVYYILGNNLDHPDTSDSNGSGKTTLLNAICWGLFGRTMAELKAGNVISDTLDSCKVHLQFDHLQVTREYGRRHKLSVKLEGATPIEGDVKEIQRELDELLGLNWNTFLNTCCMFSSNTNSKFLFAGPAERARTLGDLVDDSVFQQAARIIKRDMDGYDKESIRTSSIRGTLQDQLWRKTKQLEEFQLRYQQATQQESNRKTLLEMKIASLHNRAKEIMIEMGKVPTQNVQELQAAVVRHSQEMGRLQQDLQQATWDSSAEKTVMEGQTCPHCRRYINKDDAQHYQSIIEDAQERYRFVAAKLVEVTSLKDRTQEEYRLVQSWHSSKAAWDQELANIQEHVLDLQDQLKADHMRDLDQQRDSLATELTALHQEYQKNEELLYRYTYWTGILKQLYPGFLGEVKNILFDQIRGELEALTFSYSHQIAGDMFSIYYPTKDNSARERFEILMETGGKLRDIAAYSVGEGWRASFAVLLALRKVMMNRTGSRLNFLLIDDPVGGLDNTGQHHLAKTIQQIQQQEQNLILVTVPHGGLAYGRNITVTKVGGEARIEQ